MTDQSAEHDARDEALSILHPIIEGVGVGGRCRWSSDNLCPHYSLTLVAVVALDQAGLLVTRPGTQVEP